MTDLIKDQMNLVGLMPSIFFSQEVKENIEFPYSYLTQFLQSNEIRSSLLFHLDLDSLENNCIKQLRQAQIVSWHSKDVNILPENSFCIFLPLKYVNEKKTEEKTDQHDQLNFFLEYSSRYIISQTPTNANYCDQQFPRVLLIQTEYNSLLCFDRSKKNIKLICNGSKIPKSITSNLFPMDWDFEIYSLAALDKDDDFEFELFYFVIQLYNFHCHFDNALKKVLENSTDINALREFVLKNLNK